MRAKGLNVYKNINENTVEVITQNGKSFYISPESVELIKKYTWGFNDNRYIRARINNKRVMLHNFLMNPPRGYVVDHIDGNTLNYCLNNLRVILKSQNMLNKTEYKNSKYFRGVTFDAKENRFKVRIQVKCKPIFLGYFNDLDKAIEVRLEAEQKYFGNLRRYK